MEFNEIDRRKLTLDDLAQRTENGVEFWYARDLQELLEYTEWRNFEVAIQRAILSALTSKTAGKHQFVEINKLITSGKGAKREIKDYKLTRYACSLSI